MIDDFPDNLNRVFGNP